MSIIEYESITDYYVMTTTVNESKQEQLRGFAFLRMELFSSLMSLKFALK